MNEFLVKLVANGGKGSGNFTPGQGRGVGKPASGTSKTPSSKYVDEMSKYVKSKGNTSVDSSKAWSIEDTAKKYLEKADVSVKDSGDFYQLLVDYKDYSASFPLYKDNKENFKKDFIEALVKSQEQIFGQDASHALVSSSESRKYMEETASKIEKELEVK